MIAIPVTYSSSIRWRKSYTIIRNSTVLSPRCTESFKYCCVDMYTACAALSVKQNILNNFTAVDEMCRVVIATIVFKMANVQQKVDRGLPHSVQLYSNFLNYGDF